MFHMMELKGFPRNVNEYDPAVIIVLCLDGSVRTSGLFVISTQWIDFKLSVLHFLLLFLSFYEPQFTGSLHESRQLMN
jgi:hypothetical protein